eukprot:Mycagemm_TRINITY_DN8398_c0_g1::TRINITY_DN8398_c0_g1_i1::g.5539::m.5539 type:complete len:147 gc:universal TRINITY_DN8398_c0_g1_i1:240-680(+)
MSTSTLRAVASRACLRNGRSCCSPQASLKTMLRRIPMQCSTSSSLARSTWSRSRRTRRRLRTSHPLLTARRSMVHILMALPALPLQMTLQPLRLCLRSAPLLSRISSTSRILRGSTRTPRKLARVLRVRSSWPCRPSLAGVLPSRR